MLSTCSGLIFDLRWFTTKPALENWRSTLVDVAGIEWIRFASFDNNGYSFYRNQKHKQQPDKHSSLYI